VLCGCKCCLISGAAARGLGVVGMCCGQEASDNVSVDVLRREEW